MKKSLFFSAFFLLGYYAIAQTTTKIFKPFKVDVNLGYAIPQGAGTKAGVLFSVEPKYGITDEVDLGLRLGVAVTARGVPNGNGGSTSAEVKANASYLLTGDYFFTNTNVRPFVGAGLGAFTFAGARGTASTSTALPSATKFGELLRAGVEAGHFRAGVEYNFVPDKNGYFGISIGVKIGGGRYKK